MYRITTPELFVDHQAQKRSGHMGHAMVRYAPGCLLDFYSNVDYDRVSGHSGYGWMEYRRSEDGGRTWGPVEVLDYSRRMFEEGIHTALCEKAVCTDDGVICLLFQITDASLPIACEPWSEPTYILSSDQGRTWSAARMACTARGRIYDALSRDGKIQFLMQRNEHFIGTGPEHDFALYCMDRGENRFRLQSVLPVDGVGKGYCTMEYDAQGNLLAYVYDSRDESHMPCCISEDGGNTWRTAGSPRFAKLIRNPQLVRTSRDWFLHGRNGNAGDGLVLYHSTNGLDWDEGQIVATRPCPGVGYYSNNLYLPESSRLLIQFSHVYDHNRVNIMHMWIENT